MSALFDTSHVCAACGTGHTPTPCSYPCVCRCRGCDARMDCRGVREPAMGHPAYGKARSKDLRKEDPTP